MPAEWAVHGGRHICTVVGMTGWKPADAYEALAAALLMEFGLPEPDPDLSHGAVATRMPEAGNIIRMLYEDGYRILPTPALNRSRPESIQYGGGQNTIVAGHRTDTD